MRYNGFDEPLPANAAEIAEAVDSSDYSAWELMAYIYSPDPEDAGTDFDGWTATVNEAESGFDVFATLAFETRESLVSALEAVGITEIEED